MGLKFREGTVIARTWNLLNELNGKALYMDQIMDALQMPKDNKTKRKSVQEALLRLFMRGWIRRYRTKSGRYIFRTRIEGEEMVRHKPDVESLQVRKEKILEKQALSKHMLQKLAHRIPIGEEFPVKVSDEHYKWLPVIKKTENLCIFEGLRSCQWVDIYWYKNGAIEMIG